MSNFWEIVICIGCLLGIFTMIRELYNMLEIDFTTVNTSRYDIYQANVNNHNTYVVKFVAYRILRIIPVYITWQTRKTYSDKYPWTFKTPLEAEIAADISFAKYLLDKQPWIKVKQIKK